MLAPTASAIVVASLQSVTARFAGGREWRAQTASGRIAAAVFCGILAVAFIAGCMVMLRRPARLEITEDAIRYTERNGHVSALSRQSGKERRFVQRARGWRFDD